MKNYLLHHWPAARLWQLYAALAVCILLAPTTRAQWVPVVEDRFYPNQVQYEDLSTLTLWGSPPAVRTAFKLRDITDDFGLTMRALVLKDSAVAHSGFTSINSMKTASAIDYRIPTVVRTGDSVLIQLDALWDTLQTVGEAGRIVVALMHGMRPTAYPFGLLDSVSQPAPFGRPAYNFRMLNKVPVSNRGGLYLFYGGGNNINGEVELYRSGSDAWWLPGFIAQPGGTAPGTGGQYPSGPCFTNFNALASQTRWQRITMLVAPEKLYIYLKPTADSLTPGYGTEIAEIAIPRTDRGTAAVVSEMNAVHRTNISQPPLLYNWFPEVNGVRLYYRASQRAFVTNMKVYTTRHLTSLSAPERIALNLFPNPAQDWLVMNPKLEGTAYTLLNTAGQVVQKGQYAGGIDLRSLNAGLYWVQVGSARERFVKQ